MNNSGGNGVLSRILLYIGCAIAVTVAVSVYLSSESKAWNQSEHKALQTEFETMCGSIGKQIEFIREDLKEIKQDVKDIKKEK